jgi:hypothetical protein
MEAISLWQPWPAFGALRARRMKLGTGDVGIEVGSWFTPRSTSGRMIRFA